MDFHGKPAGGGPNTPARQHPQPPFKGNGPGRPDGSATAECGLNARERIHMGARVAPTISTVPPYLSAVQENVSVINDLYQVPIFEKLPVLGARASVAPVIPLTWSMATYFQTPEAGSCWYW